LGEAFLLGDAFFLGEARFFATFLGEARDFLLGDRFLAGDLFAAAFFPGDFLAGDFLVGITRPMIADAASPVFSRASSIIDTGLLALLGEAFFLPALGFRGEADFPRVAFFLGDAFLFGAALPFFFVSSMGGIKASISGSASGAALALAGIDFLLPALPLFGEAFLLGEAARAGEAAFPLILLPGETSSASGAISASGSIIMEALLGEAFLPLAGDFFGDFRLAGDFFGDLRLAGDFLAPAGFFFAGDFLLAGDFFALAGDFLGLTGAAASSSSPPPRE
jgi:hypothetical protein